MPIRSSRLGANWSDPAFVANDSACERDCYFSPFLFSVKKKRENFYVIENIFRIIFRMFYTICCLDGGPKSIGRQKQKLCHFVFGWQSTGYEEVQKKTRVRK